VQEFQRLISLSALHVYFSALPFTPKGTVLFKVFSEKVQDTVKVLSGRSLLWSHCLCVLEGHTGSITDVAVSPDGSKIVSGSEDKTVRIWDVTTGAQVGEALQGHTDIVTSVVFSPDSSKVVSGSDDKTLRIWDVNTGTQVKRPCKGTQT